ncbi:MAG: NAD(+) synthase [Fretibacterium sp.]|nr:NAD(+) synthase [Fretibacterium sp.]
MSYARDASRLTGFLETWLQEHVAQAGAKGIAVGLSGGVDSAVVAALGHRLFGSEMKALILPCHSKPEDALDAELVAGTLGFSCETVDLTPAYNALVLGIGGADALSRLVGANLKARLRMTVLYAVAQSCSLLVCGTSNRAEREVGYFTKFGDSASDLLPLAGLLKCEVRAVAAYLGVPERIIRKVPTAGLWEGQTDEGELGFSYDVLDRYLATGKAEPALQARIENLRRRSEHKRLPVPLCRPDF